MSPPQLLGRTFRSLRHRNYSLYFIGQVVSFTGSWMQSTALMWLVYALTNDPLWPPLMLVAAVGPALAGLLFRLARAVVDADWLPGSKPVMLGAIWCFTLNAISYVALLMALARIQVVSPTPPAVRIPGRFWDGFRYLGARPGMA